MLVDTKRITVEEFDAWVNLPENADNRLEFVGGQIVETPVNAYLSELAGNVAFFIKLHLYQNQLKGHITGADGGYQVAGERYAPDVAYLSEERQPELDKQGYNSVPPELAVEVISPTDKETPLRIKIINYLAVGTVVWVVDPEQKTVEVYVSGQPVQVIHEDGTLDGGTVLPGFQLAVKQIFEK